MTLELSGPRLRLALEGLVARAEDQGGVEGYVEALKIKSILFRDALAALELKPFRALCAHMATVRRRIGPYLEPAVFPDLKSKIEKLLAASGDTMSTDVRMAAFCAAFFLF